ncbi:MAG: alkaline phosphatase family protein [Gemmatimonadota bacterium]|jgi:2,3-bisphosphoglycerate-independent phosphoglycerate mutase
MPTARVLFVFLDGIGLGPANEANPLGAARLPTFGALLDGRGPFADAAGTSTGRATLVGIDASHGQPGIPQSGTGHTTLLTGEDAVKRFGRHYGPWVPTSLRPLVAERSVLAVAREAERRVAFANAYPEELLERIPAGVPVAEAVRSRTLGPLRAGPPLAALGAGVLDRATSALERGDAVASEITNDGWIHRLGRTSLPEPTPEQAGRSLSRIAASHDLTLFAHYTLDHVGHRGTWEESVAALERVDAFLGGVLDALPPDTLLIVASDHGNIEDVEREHTLNPALGLAVGPGHSAVAERIEQLRDVTGAILGVLGIDHRSATSG